MLGRLRSLFGIHTETKTTYASSKELPQDVWDDFDRIMKDMDKLMQKVGKL